MELEQPAGCSKGPSGAAAARRTASRINDATLVRAAPELRAAVAVFEPQPAPLAALSARLKEQFDPAGILNPGRMG